MACYSKKDDLLRFSASFNRIFFTVYLAFIKLICNFAAYNY